MELTLLIAWFILGVTFYAVKTVFFSNKEENNSQRQYPSPRPNQGPSASRVDTSALSSTHSSPQPQTEEHHYFVNRNLFTKAETHFFRSLEEALEDELRIFGKVRIADVMNVKKGLTKREWGFQFGRIKAKHFDYVLCDPSTLKVVCAIELDDSSHQRPDRVKRDDFVNAICDKTGLKLHRFKVAMNYDVEQIRDRIFPSTPKFEPVNPAAVITDLKQSLEVTPDLIKTANKDTGSISGGNPWQSS